jgi:hydroxymethylpyrimidine pyrophosphatase-like HAD family hydrolase
MTATRTRPDWVDITPGHVTKATALETLRKQLGIPKDRTVAIGDSENDIPMFMWAERSVAMGHASDIVRFTAKYGTKSVEDDGAAYILRSLAGIRATAPMTL